MTDCDAFALQWMLVFAALAVAGVVGELWEKWRR